MSTAKNQKGFASLLIVVIILVLVVAGMGYYIYQQGSFDSPSVTSDSSSRNVSIDDVGKVPVSESDKTTDIDKELESTELELGDLDKELQELESDASSI